MSARWRATGGRVNADGDTSKLVAYATSQAHSSVEKGLRIAGIGTDRIRTIAHDASFAMVPDALAEAIVADKAAGLVPFFVCSTHGTTSSMAFDPTPEIGAICQTHNVWLHVDAAMSGIAALAPEHRWVNEGLDLADSYCTNPHKWMGVNFDCDLYWTADRVALLGALSILPEYLRSAAAESGAAIDYRDWQIPLGRRFRALKLWFAIRLDGLATFQSMIRHHVTMTQELAALVPPRRPVRNRGTAPVEPAVCQARRRRRRDGRPDRTGQRHRLGVVHAHRARRSQRAAILDRGTDDRDAPRARRLEPAQRSRNNWMRTDAVAPQTVSSSSSKKCNSRSVGGVPHRSERYVSGRDELGERHPQHAVDLRAVRSQLDRRRRPCATTGTM